MGHFFSKYRIWPIVAFLFICGLGFGARQAIGTVYGGADAAQLLEALSRAGLYLGSAVATASATTLALMLTLVGMIRRAETEFDTEAYTRVILIARMSTITLMSSLIMLLAFVFPVGEFDALPTDWYGLLYEGLFAATVLTVALLAATVLVVYMTLEHVIRGVTPGDNL
ncbi:hypothetical protein F7D01_11405 [Erythrobacter sp. 3-20A1M]|nr:hypothetical protein F7D01_11405 [Erythrobacter sp. 3-20A1M]